MPAVANEYKANDREVNSAGNVEQTARLKLMDTHQKYYDGLHARFLKPDPTTGQDDNIIINLCGRAVDKTAEFIGTPKRILIPALKEVVSPAEKNPVQDKLDAWWKDYRAMTSEIVQSGLICGHNFMKLYFDENNYAAMTLLDPRYISVFWDVLNPRKVVFYRVQWKIKDVQYRQDI